jgi:YebC/PmpR family DNA-binding regulatory protein
MPKDTIQRAIDKASGGEGSQIKEIVYEGFGPHGVAMLIAVTTDNSNRTVADLKNVMDRNGGKMASQNAVSYMFTKCGVAEFSKSSMTEADMFAFTDAVNALDVEETDTHYIIFIPFESIGHVRDLTQVVPISIDTYFKPQTTVELTDEQHEKLDALIEKVEDHDDTQNVYTNAV